MHWEDFNKNLKSKNIGFLCLFCISLSLWLRFHTSHNIDLLL
nr:MAG TPA: hypothetical protein [Caudoviricetes sp.]